MSLIKYSPFADLEALPMGIRTFQDTMNRLFAEPNARPWVPPVDIKETENGADF
jgi:HSP20 family molecular chaperone IbpA